MDVKETVGIAKTYVTDLFADEVIINVGLEEVIFDEPSGDWKVTIGFSRYWTQSNALTTILRDRHPDRQDRSYKVVRIRDRDGHVISLTDRLLVQSTD